MADDHVITIAEEETPYKAKVYQPRCSCGNYPTRRNQHRKFMTKHDAQVAGQFHVLGAKYSRYHV